MLTAKEVEMQLRDRVGAKAMENGTIPGPNGNWKPKTKDDRIIALHYLDRNPSVMRRSVAVNTDVRDSIIAGCVGKSFLKNLEGGDKTSTRLGHQNEIPYLRQFFADSTADLVPGLYLCDIRQCGLAMQKQRPFVRDSADAIAFEECVAEGEYLDTIQSHPVELKCRSGSGVDGSLSKAYRIQAKVAELGGPESIKRVKNKHSVYCRISSRQRDLITQLIPSKSERIQILHHAFTYGKNRTTFLVGGPHGNILYGITVEFEPHLLENYGKVLDHLYENGLKTFYEDDVADLPLDYIESVLLGNADLKKKYDLNDFMTSYLIWRALLPTSTNPNVPNYPVPSCNMLVPLDYAQWNSSKGGSDTATRFTYNCQVILPVKAPQAAVISRLLQLEGVVFHRLSQFVTGKKSPDADAETIENVRNRNNKRMSFHDSYTWLCARLLKEAHSPEVTTSTGAEAATAATKATFCVERAERYNKKNKNTRFEKNHLALGVAGETGATPLGRAFRKDPKHRTSKHDAFDQRCAECKGRPIRLVVKGEDDSGKKRKSSDNNSTGGSRKKQKTDPYEFSRHTCDVCGKNGVSWFCLGCKRTLCFDQDRTELLRGKLRDPKSRDKLSTKIPFFSEFARNDTPAYRCEIGEIRGKMHYTNMSCFHYAHRNFLSGEGQVERNEEDSQLAAIAEKSGSASQKSPLAK